MVDFEDKLFWITRSGWPSDAYGYVFLGRAVRDIGKALFPDEWTGHEMAMPEPYPHDIFFIDGEERTEPKPLFWIELPLLTTLERVLLENHKDVRIERTAPPARRPILTEEQYMVALLTIEKINPLRVSARLRAATVKQVIEHALRDGKIKFALLPARGGEFITQTQAFWWNIPSSTHRWKRCQMSPADPYSTAFSGAGFMHVFVDGADLKSITESVKKPEAKAATPMLQSSNETYAAALALLPSRPKGGIRAFEAYCAEHGISTPMARQAYRSLGETRGRKRS